DTQSDVTLDSVLISNNNALRGGGVFLPQKFSNAVPILKRVGIISNEAEYGGGVYAGGKSSGILKLSNVKVAHNTASHHGGGLYAHRSSNVMEMSDVIISYNTAGDKGGGLFIPSAKPTIQRAVINGNTGSEGGGIYVSSSADLTLINTIVYGNLGTEGGSAIHGYSQPMVRIYHSTISKNTASEQATIYSDYGTKIYFYNSILWDNEAPKQVVFGGSESNDDVIGRFEARNSIIQGLGSIEPSVNDD
ncbi:uncharacterized protein METZ01_LOCUS468813, partial [marine metagenome]